MTNISNRPRPILTAATQLKNWISVAAAVVAALGSAGILLSTDQVTALQSVLAALMPLIAALGPVLTAFGIVRRSEPLVTPMEDPRDNDGTPLVAMPEVPPQRGVLR